jgi:hypothetical protein
MSNTEKRQEFTVRLRALPRANGILAPRRVLKFALRQCGLRAVAVTEESVTQSMEESSSNAQMGRK